MSLARSPRAKRARQWSWPDLSQGAAQLVHPLADHVQIERVLGVVDEDDLVQVRASGVAVYELGRVSYLNTGNLNLGTLLRPNPEDDLRTVILVSNQPSTSGADLTGERSDAD